MNVEPKILFITSGITFGVTAFGKLFLLLAAGKGLEHRFDPVIDQMPSVYTAVGAIVVELSVLVMLLFSKSIKYKALAVTSAAGLFLTYRIGMNLNGFRGDCGCLGVFQTWLSLAAIPALDTILVVILCGMVLFGAAVLVRSTSKTG